MPIYEYECKKCDKVFEKIQKFSDPILKKCPDCGSKVEKLMSLSSFRLKGTGYYSTDYKKPSQPKVEKEPESTPKETKERPEIAEAKAKVGCGKKKCGHKH